MDNYSSHLIVELRFSENFNSRGIFLICGRESEFLSLRLPVKYLRYPIIWKTMMNMTFTDLKAA